jgi:hypothetical protein
MCVCSLIPREGIKQFTPNLTSLCLQTRKRFKKVKSTKKSVLNSSSSSEVSLAPKIRTIEGHQIRTVCLGEGIK